MGSQDDLEEWLERCKETGWRSTERLAGRGRGAQTTQTAKIESAVAKAKDIESHIRDAESGPEPGGIATHSTATDLKTVETDIKAGEGTEDCQNCPSSALAQTAETATLEVSVTESMTAESGPELEALPLHSTKSDLTVTETDIKDLPLHCTKSDLTVTETDIKALPLHCTEPTLTVRETDIKALPLHCTEPTLTVRETAINAAAEDGTQVMDSQNSPSSNLSKVNVESEQIESVLEAKENQPDEEITVKSEKDAHNTEQSLEAKENQPNEEIIVKSEKGAHNTEQSKLDAVSENSCTGGHDQPLIGTECNELTNCSNSDSGDKSSEIQDCLAGDDGGISDSASCNLYENVPTQYELQEETVQSSPEHGMEDKPLVSTYENLPIDNCDDDDDSGIPQKEICSSFNDNNLDGPHIASRDAEGPPNGVDCGDIASRGAEGHPNGVDCADIASRGAAGHPNGVDCGDIASRGATGHPNGVDCGDEASRGAEGHPNGVDCADIASRDAAGHPNGVDCGDIASRGATGHPNGVDCGDEASRGAEGPPNGVDCGDIASRGAAGHPNGVDCADGVTGCVGDCCGLYSKVHKTVLRKPPCGKTLKKLSDHSNENNYINVGKYTRDSNHGNLGQSDSNWYLGKKDSFHSPYPLYEEIVDAGHHGNAAVSSLIGDESGVYVIPSSTSRTHDDVTDDVYDEIRDAENNTGSYSSFEPPWAQSVGKKGDVFYVEPGTADWNSEPPPGGTDPNYHHHGGTAPSTPTHNGLNNSTHLPHHQPHADMTPSKTKKGLKKKVKGIITPRSKQNNNVDAHHQQNGHVGNGVARNNYRNQVNHSPHTVTFNDVPTGLTKDVRLYVDPHRHNYGRRATLCETLFGIVPGYFGPKVSRQNGTTQDRRIMVQGLLPGGEALRCGQVKIGDWLMCVNDLEVNFDNFDSLLSAITTSMEVKLTLQKLAVQAVSTPRPGVVRKSPVVNEALVRLVSGDRAHLPSPSLTDVPHSIMFLTLESREDGPPKQDVLYQFPAEDSKLVEIRGLFLTLGNLLPDITDNTPRSSSMLIENKLVHVAYAREGKQVLIIALPADRLKLVQVNQIVEDVVRLLRVLYGSLKGAFSSKENAGRLDHFFSLFTQRALLKQEMVKEGLQTPDQDEPLLDLLAGVRALHLPEETKVIVNNTLSDFEAADFADMSEEFYDLRRSYTIMGSALFYKGYLLASHLHREDLRDVTLYLRYYYLLTLCHSEQMGQMVVWKEVFPWRRCHVQTDPLLPGYTEPEARWFLLVVGLKNIMLTVLFEAGGAASWAEGHPTPDPFYVDQAKGSLLQLEALDIPNQCELRLVSPSIPSLASVDWFFPNTKGTKDEAAVITTPLVKVQNSPKTGVSPSRKLLQPESILKKRGGSTPSPQNDRLRPPGARPGALYDVESDADSHSTGNSDTSTPIMDRRGRKPSAGSDESGGSGGSSSLFKGQKKKRTLLSAYDVSGLKSSLREAAMEEGSFVKLTSGCDNTLFHYVHLDCTEGVFICPTQQELAAVSTPTHSRLLTNFHTACLAIRHVFHDTAKKQSVHAAGRSGPFGAGSALGTVREHGVLFHCTPENWTDTKKQPPVVSYWVVGRQLPEPYTREMYVCFHDSAQQNVIELAFKLGFGILV